MNQNARAGLQFLSAFISNGPKWSTRLSALKCASRYQSVEHVGCRVGGPSMNSDKLFPLPSHPFINSVSFVRHRMNWAAIDFALCVQNNVSFTKEYSHASHSKVLVLFPWINHPHLLNPFHFTTQAHLSQWKEKSLNYFKLKSYLAWRGIKDHLPILWINYAENKSSILVLPGWGISPQRTSNKDQHTIHRLIFTWGTLDFSQQTVFSKDKHKGKRLNTRCITLLAFVSKNVGCLLYVNGWPQSHNLSQSCWKVKGCFWKLLFSIVQPFR